MDPEMLKYLVCPACYKKLKEVDNRLLCQSCNRSFEIRDGIPIMLLEKSK